MLEQSKSIENAVRLVTQSLKQNGYKTTVEQMKRAPAETIAWQRRNGILAEALKKISKDLNFNFYNLIQETEEDYGVAHTDPKVVSRVFNKPEYKNDPIITYTVGLSNHYKCPEFVVSSNFKTQNIKLIEDIVSIIVDRGSLDIGEPLVLNNTVVLFKQFSPKHKDLLPLLKWYNSSDTVFMCQILYRFWPWECIGKKTQALYWEIPFKYH